MLLTLACDVQALHIRQNRTRPKVESSSASALGQRTATGGSSGTQATTSALGERTVTGSSSGTQATTATAFDRLHGVETSDNDARERRGSSSLSHETTNLVRESTLICHACVDT